MYCTVTGAGTHENLPRMVYFGGKFGSTRNGGIEQAKMARGQPVWYPLRPEIDGWGGVSREENVKIAGKDLVLVKVATPEAVTCRGRSVDGGG